MVQSTVLTMEQFWELPTARNSNRWPPYGNGDVRLRSSAGRSKSSMAATPKLHMAVDGTYSLNLPLLRKASR